VRSRTARGFARAPCHGGARRTLLYHRIGACGTLCLRSRSQWCLQPLGACAALCACLGTQVPCPPLRCCGRMPSRPRLLSCCLSEECIHTSASSLSAAWPTSCVVRLAAAAGPVYVLVRLRVCMCVCACVCACVRVRLTADGRAAAELLRLHACMQLMGVLQLSCCACTRVCS